MNEQIADALNQLRDIHEPLAPSWWPPAIGWWLLVICIVVGIVSLAVWITNRRNADRPYRELRQTALALQRIFGDQTLPESEYLNTVNRLFKYLLVNLESTPGATQADGVLWLHMLAQRFHESAFVDGVGLTLGNSRYTRQPYFDKDLTSLVDNTLCKVKKPESRLVAND